MLTQTSLAYWLRKQSIPFSLQQTVNLIRQAADAVQELHDQQMMHLDINPSSFLVHETSQGSIDLILSDTGTNARPATHMSRIFPTNSMPAYMAPEQWIGQGTFASDQYALAVMAYEMMTGGSLPFQGPPAQLLDLHTNAQPPIASSINARVTPAIDTVLSNALAKRPEDRFPSVAAFSNALEQAVRVPGSMIVNAHPGPDGNLQAAIYLSNTEAKTGTLRTVQLPQNRRVVVAVPKDAYDGQKIRLDNIGEPSTGNSPRALLLTAVVTQTDTHLPAVHKIASQQLNGTGSTGPHTPVPLEAVPGNTLSKRTTWSTRVNTIAGFSTRRKIALAALVLSILVILILGSVGVYALLQPNASVPYPPGIGSLSLNDALHDNSSGYNWPDASATGGGICQFTQRAYHVTINQQGTFHYCLAGASDYSNFAYEVQMTLIRGDGGGIIFRADDNKGTFYYFRIARDGSYGLYLYTDSQAAHAKTLAFGRAAPIHSGLNIPNTVAVVAHGSILDLYVNYQRISTSNDTSYSSGQLGVAAAYDTEPTEVVFNNARVWSL